MKKLCRIALALTVTAFIVQTAPLLHAGDLVLIDPGVPQTHPDDGLVQTSFDHMLPTTYPIVQTGPPNIQADSDNLVHTSELPVVPKCTP